MYLRKIVKLPIIGTKIVLEAAEKREVVKWQWIERKREEVRRVSNLYGRMENMKVRLEHSAKNDPYTQKDNPKLRERDEFYGKQQQVSNQYSNLPVDQIIHAKQPVAAPPEATSSPEPKTNYKDLFREELMQAKEPIRKNEDYIHKTMAPQFLTNSEHNVNYSRANEGSIYGLGPYAEKRNIKIGLPKLQNLDTRIKHANSYHLVGKLTRNRQDINQKVKSFSVTQQPEPSKIEKERE